MSKKLPVFQQVSGYGAERKKSGAACSVDNAMREVSRSFRNVREDSVKGRSHVGRLKSTA